MKGRDDRSFTTTTDSKARCEAKKSQRAIKPQKPVRIREIIDSDFHGIHFTRSPRRTSSLKTMKASLFQIMICLSTLLVGGCLALESASNSAGGTMMQLNKYPEAQGGLREPSKTAAGLRGSNQEPTRELQITELITDIINFILAFLNSLFGGSTATTTTTTPAPTTTTPAGPQ